LFPIYANAIALAVGSLPRTPLPRPLITGYGGVTVVGDYGWKDRPRGRGEGREKVEGSEDRRKGRKGE